MQRWRFSRVKEEGAVRQFRCGRRVVFHHGNAKIADLSQILRQHVDHTCRELKRQFVDQKAASA